jgi:hypothetical protein
MSFMNFEKTSKSKQLPSLWNPTNLVTLVAANVLLDFSCRPNLPFTECVIQEVLRVSCIAPLAVPHYAQVSI